MVTNIRYDTVLLFFCFYFVVSFFFFFFFFFWGGGGLMLNVPVNNFSVMLGLSHRFLGITSTFFFFGGGGGVNMSCSRTQHGDPSGARTLYFSY